VSLPAEIPSPTSRLLHSVLALFIALGLGLILAVAGAAARPAAHHHRSPAHRHLRRHERVLGVIRPHGFGVRHRHHAHARAAAISNLANPQAPANIPGAVMHSNRVYVIYWTPPSATAMSSGYSDAITRFLTDVSADSGRLTNVYATDVQYGDPSGAGAYASTYGGSITATDPYPAVANQCTETARNVRFSACLTDNQIVAEIDRVVSAQHWPRGMGNLYMLMTPPGVGSCYSIPSGAGCAFAGDGNGFCAYHSGFVSGSRETFYANMPYAATAPGCESGQSPNANVAADEEISLISHEHNEAITDPRGDAWLDSQSLENGDKCAQDYGVPLGGSAPAGTAFNQLINGHQYWLQEEWSNAASACVQDMTGASPPPSSPPPVNGGGPTITPITSPGPGAGSGPQTPPASPPPSSSGTPSVASPPAPAPTPSPALSAPATAAASGTPAPVAPLAEVSLVSQRLGSVVRSGLLVNLAPAVGERFSLTLSVDRATARSLHLSRRGSLILGHTRLHADAGVPLRLRVMLARGARRHLAHRRQLRLTLRVVITDAAGHARTSVRVLHFVR